MENLNFSDIGFVLEFNFTNCSFYVGRVSHEHLPTKYEVNPMTNLGGISQTCVKLEFWRR